MLNYVIKRLLGLIPYSAYRRGAGVSVRPYAAR